ncbi:MAG: tetratricopeptide repeat protein [Thermodesulfobacteriota bacterium]
MRELQGIIDDVQDLKVLVVDDQANMRRTVKSMLRALGFQKFTEAEDGDAALRIIGSGPLDLIICDWNMPRVKGVEVLRTMRKDRKYDDVSFLMLTGEVAEDRVAETIEAEVDAYIIKPFQIQTLEEKLIGILTKRKAPSALDVQIKLAEKCLAEGDVAQAHRELDKAAQVRPRSPKLYFQRGLVFEAEGKMAEAEKCFHLAKQLGPLFIKVHDKLAHIYQARGRNAEVCVILGEAVKISPNNINRQMRLGRAYLAEKRYEEARKAFAKVLSLDRDNQNRKLAIGKMYITSGLLGDAEKVFKQFIEAHPGNLDAYNRLGILLRRIGRHEEAVDYYRQALKVAPKDPNLYFNLARVLLDLNRQDDAAAHLRRALSLDPDFEEARTVLNKMKTGEY